jgi:predicted ArsR family transcriptional regulator
MPPDQPRPVAAARHAALASATRRQILDALTAAPGPLDARDLAGRLGLHVTTIRFHLDHLENAGLVRSTAEARTRPGRPRLTYTARTTPAGEAGTRERLIDILAASLADETGERGEQVAVAAGRSWAAALSTDAAPAAGRTVLLTETLARLGFDPDQGEAAIALRACPFRDAARARPQIVCGVHRGLVEGLLAPGQATLNPFVEPELCTITLG